MSEINPGSIWVTRVFRDNDCRLRVFRVEQFLNLSVAVTDMEEIPPKLMWYAKGDLQFFDLLKEGANEEGSQEGKPGERRGPNKAPGRN